MNEDEGDVLFLCTDVNSRPSQAAVQFVLLLCILHTTNFMLYPGFFRSLSYHVVCCELVRLLKIAKCVAGFNI